MEQKMKTDIELLAYENTKGEFVDYTHFESDKTLRSTERDAFINNLEYTPNYDYPKLDFLIDEGSLLQKKKAIYEAVMELDVAKNSPGINKAELELFADFHEMRLKKIMLVEAARNLCNPITMTSQEINRQSFAELNETLYGEFNFTDQREKDLVLSAIAAQKSGK